MIKRYSASHCPKCAQHEDDYNIKDLELFESQNGKYVLYDSHKVTATLYNKTLKNYVAVKADNKLLVDENLRLVDENAQLLNRIAELEKI